MTGIFRLLSFYDVEKHRGTTFVDMDDRGIITAAKGEEKRIATVGLATCTAVAIAGKLPDETRWGYVQHYSPLKHRLGIRRVSEAVQVLATDKATNVRAVVMTPGEWTQLASGKWVIASTDELYPSSLTSLILSEFGEADVQTHPYSPNYVIGNYGQGSLMVEFLADGAMNMVVEAMPV